VVAIALAAAAGCPGRGFGPAAAAHPEAGLAGLLEAETASAALLAPVQVVAEQRRQAALQGVGESAARAQWVLVGWQALRVPHRSPAHHEVVGAPLEA